MLNSEKEKFAVVLYSIIQENEPLLPVRTEWDMFYTLEKWKLMEWANRLLNTLHDLGYMKEDK